MKQNAHDKLKSWLTAHGYAYAQAVTPLDRLLLSLRIVDYPFMFRSVWHLFWCLSLQFTLISSLLVITACRIFPGAWIWELIPAPILLLCLAVQMCFGLMAFWIYPQFKEQGIPERAFFERE
ncbi:MAG: hypothetical protein KF767_12710 [Bdellovibrionaceae bacterium]|nr:hypothetical protein [Pseudobdellovibrionaceae bacterium]